MEFTIIGGGIAGLTLAVALTRSGKQVRVYEAAPQIQAAGAGLALAANAIKAFAAIGLKDELIRQGRLLDEFRVYDKRGRLISRTDNRLVSRRYGEDNFTIHRAKLHSFLLSQLDPACIRTGMRAVDADQDATGVQLTFQDGSSARTDYLILADGIHSAVRKKLLPASVERYAGYTCWRAVIDNSDLDLREASETWGPRGRFGIVPLSGGQLYWFACVNAARNDARYRQFTVADLLEQFEGYHDPIPALLRATADEDLLWNDIIDLAPVARYNFGRILLIGDAAHATTPNLGQGACQAIEDAVILAREIDRMGDPYVAFQTFEKRRLERTHWVIRTSRRLGRLAQLEHPLLTRLRDFLLRQTPQSAQQRMWRRLYEVQF